MSGELKRLQNETGVSGIYVTYHQSEALSLPSRIAIMNATKLTQLAAPGEKYGCTSSRLVADFFGETDFQEGAVAGLGENETTVGTAIELIGAAVNLYEEKGIRVVLRPRPEYSKVGTTARL